jgi:hypothetical protein
MRGENGGDIDMTLPAERNSESGLPFMEMSDNSSVELTRGELG